MRVCLVLLVLISLISSCVSLHSVSLSSIPEVRSQEIKAEVAKTVFLAFNFNNDFVDELSEQLRKQCPGGKVQGILTKHMMIGYFLVFVHQIEARGYCVKGA